MGRKYSVFITALFCAVLGLLFAANLLLPDRDYSPMENRALAQRPTLSARDFRWDGDFFGGAFMSKYETYVNDQFVWRERLILLKAQSERAMGKRENNAVYFCVGGTLISRPAPLDETRAAQSLDYVTQFAAQMEIPVYFSLIPGKATVWADRLPAGAPTGGESEMLALARRADAHWIELEGALAAHRDEALYYRTDHHWTSLGAWYGYCALAEGMGLSPAPLSRYEKETVSADFLGTDFSASGAGWVAPDEIDLYVPEDGIAVTSWFSAGAEEGALYVRRYLAEKDQYSVFLGGVQKLCVIRTEKTDGQKLLVIRDSFADSLAPFLTAHFSEIHLMDLRYNKTSPAAYAADIGADAVLILYSANNFAADTNLFLLSR